MRRYIEVLRRPALGLAAVLLASPAGPALASAESPQPREAVALDDSGPVVPVARLIDEALAHNPELAAARAEGEAASARLRPAAALEDPMLEAGVVNAPLPSLSLRREDMTMKMLGLSQKLPYPGKRALRQEVAAAESASLASAVDETANRVVRDIRVAYEELRAAIAAERIARRTQATLRALVTLSDGRFAVGQAAQSDVLKGQAAVVELEQELLRIAEARAARQAELRRLLGRHGDESPITPALPSLVALRADAASLKRDAGDRRPQLRALDALAERSEHELALAEREYYPDFELRLGYGQRDRAPDGQPRDDMITMTVAVNLPIWRKSRLEPRVAEARAMRRRASALAEAERLETFAGLEQQLAIEQQSRASAALYRTTLLPQARAVVESARNAYQVGRVDFLTVLDAEMRVYEAEKGEAESIASHNKAIAEIDLLSGASPETIQGAEP